VSEQPIPRRLTLDAVAHYPRPGTSAPAHIAFSPDGRLLTYLYSERGDLVRDLWALDLETGQRHILVAAGATPDSDDTVSPEEALRRERQRVREGGVTNYRWADEADRLVLILGGQLAVTSSRGEAPRILARAADPIEDARPTADGAHIVFVRGRDLWTVDVEADTSRRLTSDASETISNGVAEFIAQEEMGRSEGFWIAPDGQRIAYTRVDEGHIPAYPIVHQGGDAWRVESHRYPFAGAANAHVRLAVLPIAGGKTRWLDSVPDDRGYLARVDWRPDGSLAVQVESRDQRRLDLILVDPASGERSTLLTETSPSWINLHRDLRFLSDCSFIWSSERTGYRHLELRGPDGSLVRQLTDGAWPVDALVHVDEARRTVYFVAGRESPLGRDLYAVSLDGGAITRLSDGVGFHGASFAKSGRQYAETTESRDQPPRVVIRSIDRPSDIPVHDPPSAEACAPGLVTPEIVEVSSRDGATLYGSLYRPRGVQFPAPTIVSVYGGPHVQSVTDTWGMTVDLRAQYLASLGFLVFKLDNRGSARRGLAFEAAIERRLGTIEVQDQVDGVRWLVAEGLADARRVGIYGWSYGGYMAALCLLTEPAVFRVAVAGAPVTAWDGYDTHYTERYMGTPSENPEGYARGSVLTHASRLEGRLMLVHGMIDENVHFRHTARLVAALEAAGKACDVLILPNERHMPRDEAGRRYVEERVAAYFLEHL